MAGDNYTAWTGLVYIFNLIVGTGALTLPLAFSKAGWVVGIFMMLSLAFVSFVTATFILEAIACCNAIFQYSRVKHLKRVSGALNRAIEASHSQDEVDEDEDEGLNEDAPLFSPELVQSFPSHPTSFYNLDGKIELGQMATALFSKVGSFLFYACIAVYLYGDLAIYASAMSKSLSDVICTYEPSGTSKCGDRLSPKTPCWENLSFTRLHVYRIIIIILMGAIGPFTFFNVQKTKYLQITTSVMRWIAFISMISYAIYRLATVGPQKPQMASLSGMPALVGASVYAFMCHHSLPSLVAPINDKRYLTRLLAMDYYLITAFYLLFAMTGIFAFSHLDELYTLVFSPSCSKSSGVPNTVPMRILSYFLTLFPVLTLSASFPVIAVTLRNNLKFLFLGHNETAFPWFIQHMTFPFLAVIPPILIALLSENLERLVKITGSFPGVGVQYVFPALLVWFARRRAKAVFGEEDMPNPFRSPFQGSGWVIFVLLWAFACIVLVVVNFFTDSDS